MGSALTEVDEAFLRQAIEISRRALEDQGKTPFGAIVVVNREVIGQGTSSVVELRDPTAHAEVMALRDAGTQVGAHLFPEGVMYTSSEPCPMCLVACYWAQLSRVVYGATSYDVATYGFEDLQLYRELTYTAERRSMKEDAAGGELQEHAAGVLRAWAERLPMTVEPKY